MRRVARLDRPPIASIEREEIACYRRVRGSSVRAKVSLRNYQKLLIKTNRVYRKRTQRQQMSKKQLSKIRVKVSQLVQTIMTAASTLQSIDLFLKVKQIKSHTCQVQLLASQVCKLNKTIINLRRLLPRNHQVCHQVRSKEVSMLVLEPSCLVKIRETSWKLSNLKMMDSHR